MLRRGDAIGSDAIEVEEIDPCRCIPTDVAIRDYRSTSVTADASLKG
jgi:hypothetical protein